MSADYRQASCDGKVAFDNPKLAKIAARRKTRRCAYRCKACGSWHVGSVSRRRPPRNERDADGAWMNRLAFADTD